MPLKLSILLSFLIAPVAILAMPESKDLILTVVELGTQLWLLVNLGILCSQTWGRSKPDSAIYLLLLSIFCVFCADVIYCSIVLGISAEFALLGDCFYSGFALFLLLFLVKKLNVFQRDFREWGRLFIAALAVDSFLSYWFLLEPYYRLDPEGLAMRINGTIYMGITICIFALIFPFSFRVSERRTFWFLNFIILLLTADFAIRYQGAFIGMYTLSWAEFGWCFAFIGLAWLLQLSEGRETIFEENPYTLAPFVSVRSLLTLSICAVNCLFLIGVLLLKTYSLDTAMELTSILMLLFIFWTIANEFSIWLANDLSHALQVMFRRNESLIFEKVPIKNPVYEISKILQSYNDLVDETNRMTSLVLETNRKAAVAQISSQVIHDIRSPLAALEMVVKGQTQLSEERRILVRQSIGRIKDIVNVLVKRNVAVSKDSTAGNESRMVQLLSSLIDVLISEKRMQFRSKIGVEIDSALSENSYGIFSEVDSAEFMRLLSNLINNSVEAIGNRGRVTVSLAQTMDHAVISVSDNGCGIPPEILSVLGQRGQTYRKEGGLGLGLYHAKTTIESWGGSLTIYSTHGEGTQVELMIPLAKAPGWFVERLCIPANAKIVILDDDVSIHKIWEDRFKKANSGNANVEVLHFSTPNELIDWHKQNTAQRAVFLVDHELLGFEEVGLTLIESLGIGKQSILVTSHYEEASIRDWCQRLGVPMIPKGMAGFVPIVLAVNVASTD
jgi:signal transduction histidine kinase